MHHMISKDIENLLSDFDRLYILTVLYEGPTHGYAILQKFQERLKKKGKPRDRLSLPPAARSERNGRTKKGDARRPGEEGLRPLP